MSRGRARGWKKGGSEMNGIFKGCAWTKMNGIGTGGGSISQPSLLRYFSHHGL